MQKVHRRYKVKVHLRQQVAIRVLFYVLESKLLHHCFLAVQVSDLALHQDIPQDAVFLVLPYLLSQNSMPLLELIKLICKERTVLHEID